MVCNHDCFNCTYDDCISNETTYEEYKQLDYFDYLIYIERRNERQKIQYKYNHSTKGISARERYEQSEKGNATREQYKQSEKRKAVKARYEKSEKGKALRKQYEQSEKGKASARRKAKKRIESGKNAEYCRRYYLRKKAEREAEKVSEI